MNGEVQYIIVGANGRQYGPMNLETLKSLVRDNRVGAETEVWDSTTNEWHQAQQIEELSEFFPGEGAEAPAETVVAEEAEPHTSALALASMWCGIIAVPTFCCTGWVLALLAVVLGFVARGEVKQHGYEGAQYANVGIVCGLLTLVLTAILATLFGPVAFDVLVKIFKEYKPM